MRDFSCPKCENDTYTEVAGSKQCSYCGWNLQQSSSSQKEPDMVLTSDKSDKYYEYLKEKEDNKAALNVMKYLGIFILCSLLGLAYIGYKEEQLEKRVNSYRTSLLNKTGEEARKILDENPEGIEVSFVEKELLGNKPTNDLDKIVVEVGVKEQEDGDYEVIIILE